MCVKKGGGAAFIGVSEDVVNWHIRIVGHYSAFLCFPKSPIPKPRNETVRELGISSSELLHLACFF
jgi:hypothetical protein